MLAAAENNKKSKVAGTTFVKKIEGISHRPIKPKRSNFIETEVWIITIHVTTYFATFLSRDR